uniref:LPXRFamide peptide n=1 Tax=Channa punctata TaxID=304456 RepID=A0AAT9UTY7_CHAPF
MLTTVFLSALLVLGAAADLQLYGTSIYSDKTLMGPSNGGRTVRKQPRQWNKGGIRRSLDLESFNLHVTPTTSKISLPTIIKLYPPTAKPLHLHANMPMRFGRWSDPGDDRAPNSTPNMPQRFGRSRVSALTRTCSTCPEVREAPNPVLPQRFGRNTPYWSLLRSLASEHLLNTGLHWNEGFNFPTSSEEVEMQEKTFKW